jgi:hypothetical protein
MTMQAFDTVAVGSDEWYAEHHDLYADIWSDGTMKICWTVPGMLNKFAVCALHHALMAEFLRGRAES